MIERPFTFKIGGEAGFGIMSTGLEFSKIASRSGYYVFDYAEYPSIIRGGHNVVQTNVATWPVHSPYQHTDFLVALNQETITRHVSELTPGGGVLFDQERGVHVGHLPKDAKAFAVPLNRLATTIGGAAIMRDTAALGATLALLGGKLEILQELIDEKFGAKKPEVAAKNKAVASAGYTYAAEHYPKDAKPILTPRQQSGDQIVVSGNDAIALGAIAGGMQFTAIYPMTPTSNILHILAPLQQKFGFIYEQPEDEIAAINMAIGASFAGARSMVATSGGGFCLMTEGYGLAGMTETGLVIIEGMRGGPATGLPTWTEQGDVRFVLHAHQGEFPRIVLAAGDAEEAFHLTMQAFNLADIYQTPVVLLVDKHVCESHLGVTPFSYSDYQIDRGKYTTKKIPAYHRYALSQNGISLRAPPGSGNHVVANSDEHDDMGYSAEDAGNRRAQMDKRMKKLATCAAQDMPMPQLYGPPDARLTLVSWGSNKGAILDALQEFPDVNYLHLTWINPFPSAAVTKILEQARHVINIENNYSAQMAGLIREKTGIEITDNLLKYDGRPFFPEEIIQKVKATAAYDQT